MNDLPVSLKPVYETHEPNQKILLYQGDLEIKQSINPQQPVQGHGNIYYVWLPFPSIQFEFWSKHFIDYNCPDNDLIFSNGNCRVKISIDKTIDNDSNYKDNYILGTTQEAIIRGKEQNLSYILFHVINFTNNLGIPTRYESDQGISNQSNRINFNFNYKEEKWKINLDKIKEKSFFEKFKNNGGFGITHVGKIEKDSKQCFKGEEVNNLLNVFQHFLCFSSGSYVPLTLQVGYDAGGNKVWEYWNASRGTSWQTVSSWFPVCESQESAKVFPGFLDWWETWDDSEKVALNWYLQANTTSLVEEQIILVQVALELLAWVILVEREKTLSETGFDKLPASDKIRLLLSQVRIPKDIPPTLPLEQDEDTFARKFFPRKISLDHLVQLVKQNKQNQWQDGPHALTEMRNGIIHPKKQKRTKIHQATLNAKLEVAELGLWYLELVLLAIFNYQGIYRNRLARTTDSFRNPVPWSNG